LGIGRNWDLPLWSLLTTSCLGLAYVRSQRLAEAVPLLEGAAAQSASIQTTPYHSTLIAVSSEAHLVGERIEEALRLAEQALATARRQEERGNEAWALRLLGEIASYPGSLPGAEMAEGHYAQALTLADELGMRPLVAHCHLGLGKLYRRTEKREQAQEHLTIATTMYREMEMPFWVEKAEAEMKELPERR
jgi:tetratricopeptide (TPR) repeat protein